MKGLSRASAKLILRVTATVLLLIYLATRVDVQGLQAALSALDLRCWLVAVLLYAASQLVSSYRWGRLARAVGFHETDAGMASHYFAGAFVNLALPSSLGGDALRAVRLAPGRQVSGKVLAGFTVAVDRLAGLSALLLLGCVGLLTHSQGWSERALLALSLAACTLQVLGTWPALRLLSRIRLRSSGLWQSLTPYVERPRVLAHAGGLSWIVQLLNIATVVWLGAALRLSLPLSDYFMSVPAVAVLAILPVSISGLGAREAGLAWLLPLSAEQGVSLGLLWFSVVLTTGLFGALPFLLVSRASRNLERPMSSNFSPAGSRGMSAQVSVL